MPVLTFDPGPHVYRLDGVVQPSVTQILRDSGLIKLDHIPPFILEAARARGSAVHQLVHYFNENDLDWDSVDPLYRGYLDAWVAYLHDRRFRILLCEYRIASVRRRVCGTLDCLGVLEEGGHVEGALIDFKTGEPEDVAADLQTGGYLGMAYEWAAFDPTLADVLSQFKRVRRFAIRLRRDGRFSPHPYDNPIDTSKFFTLADAWHIRTERGAIVHADDLAA
jgi:hypothetical protein